MAEENVLDVLAKLQGKGLNDAQIVAQLKNFGYTQQEISDAITQTKAKDAVAEGAKDEKGMQPSILEPRANEGEEIPVPKPMAMAKKMRKAARAVKTRDVTNQAEESAAAYPYAYQEQAMPSYAEMPEAGTGGASGFGDIETIEEIAEEVIAEKFSEIRSKIGDALDFKELVETKIANLDSRLKRIESNIDRLQASSLGRVQEYGRDIKSLGSDMHALEGAFGKILNPLVDNVKELGRITENIKKEKKIK